MMESQYHVQIVHKALYVLLPPCHKPSTRFSCVHVSINFSSLPARHATASASDGTLGGAGRQSSLGRLRLL